MKEKIQAFMAKRQAKGKRSYEIDMCNGPLLGKILRFGGAADAFQRFTALL